ncbi:MAG: BREX protein BrxB domain-containing protein [Alkalispirochaeta sp.]
MPDVKIAGHFEQTYRIVSHSRFLSRKGLGNEVPFFIDEYDPTDEWAVVEQIGVLSQRLHAEGIPTVTLPMFDIVIDVVRTIRDLDTVFAFEKKTPKSRGASTTPGASSRRRSFLTEMETWTNPESGKRLQSEIFRRLEEVPDRQVVFMHQLGTVFPYLRTHTLLNNLHSVITDTPLVVFFPGTYVSSEREGYYFSLFNTFKSDYYRAFRLEDYIEKGRIRGDIE